jgi:hypothetical protein
MRARTSCGATLAPATAAARPTRPPPPAAGPATRPCAAARVPSDRLRHPAGVAADHAFLHHHAPLGPMSGRHHRPPGRARAARCWARRPALAPARPALAPPALTPPARRAAGAAGRTGGASGPSARAAMISIASGLGTPAAGSLRRRAGLCCRLVVERKRSLPAPAVSIGGDPRPRGGEARRAPRGGAVAEGEVTALLELPIFPGRYGRGGRPPRTAALAPWPAAAP